MKKRLISILLTLLMVMSLFSGMSVSAYADDDTDKLYVEYTLVQGDYVLRICQKLGINYYTCKEAIMALNNITSENEFRYLSVGQVVKIPVSDAAAVAIMKGDSSVDNSASGNSGATTSTTVSSSDKIAYYLIPYTMQRGETVLGVCNSMGISFADYADHIMALNGISSWKKVGAGTTLLLPTNQTPAVGTTCYAVVAHKIASGETAYSLCQKYGVNYGSSTKLLQALNNSKDLAAVKAGKTFYLPVATTIKAAASTNTNTNNGSANNSNNGNTNNGSNTNTNTNTAPAKSYDLNASINTNYGTMAFYVNNKSVNSAAAGETVTVDVSTNDGRAIESLVVKYDDGRADVKLEGNTFVMPACDVRVDANIKSGYDITINSNYSFKTAATVNGVNVSSAAKGSSVKVVSTDPSYAVESVKVYYSTLLGIKKTVTVNDANYFVMPAKDVTIDVELAPVKTYNFYREDCMNGGFDIQVDGNSVSKAAKGAKVTIAWEAAKGYDIAFIKVTNNTTGKTINVFNNSFTMPASDVTIEVAFDTNVNVIDIEAVAGGILRAYDESNVVITEANTGDKVTIKGYANEDGYTGAIKSLSVVRKADGHRVNVDTATWSFNMPAGGVIITGELESDPVIVKVSFNGTGSENSVTLKCGSVKKTFNDLGGGNMSFSVGSTVELSTLARDSHAFTKFEVYVDGKFDQELTDLANEESKLYIPNAGNLELKAFFSADEITIGAADIRGKGTVSYQVNGNVALSCKIGDTVEIIAAPANAGYKVTADYIHVLNKESGKRLQVLDSDGDGHYEFQMPAEGVEIIVILAPAEHTVSMRTEPSSLNGKSLWSLYVNEEIPNVENATNVSSVKVKTGDLIGVTLNEAFKEKYQIEKVVLTGTNGKDYSGGLEYNVNDNGLYGFIMVDDDITVTVYVEELTDKTVSLIENISWNTDRGSVGSTIDYHTNPVVSTAQVGDIVCIVPKAIEPYFVDADSLTISRNSDDGKFTMGAANTENANIIDGKFYPVIDGSGKLLAWKYKMPVGGVTIHVDFKAEMFDVKVNVFSSTDTAKANNLNSDGFVSLLNTYSETLFEVSSGNVQSFEYDTGVKVQLTDSGAQLYTIKSVTAPGVAFGSYGVYQNVFFVTKDVEVEVILEPIVVEPETVEMPRVTSFNTTVSFYADSALTNVIDEAKPGDSVYVVVTPATGYTTTAKFFNAYDDTELASGTSVTYPGSKVYCVTVPEDGFYVELTEELNKHDLTVKFVDINGTAITDAGNAVKVNGKVVKNGDIITDVEYNSVFSILQNTASDTNYKLSGYAVDPASNLNRMPDQDAVLKITLVKIAT
ncbi:MAG: LysM peptidoglycan-binding domain-containing protein [Oscillospiraceae bacterium]|nr:LysM peptidoglycan-binding domain-containing protein [Oscillospiraceae bacterium]